MTTLQFSYIHVINIGFYVQSIKLGPKNTGVNKPPQNYEVPPIKSDMSEPKVAQSACYRNLWRG